MTIPAPVHVDADTRVNVSHSCNCCVPRRRQKKRKLSTEKKVTIVANPVFEDKCSKSE
jgi:hypothetical protein